MPRHTTLSLTAMIGIFAACARAEDPQLKWPEMLQPLPQTGAFANGPRISGPPFILPDLYLSRPRNSAGPVATTAKLSGPELTALSGSIDNSLVAAPSIVTRFDLGLTSTVSAVPSIVVPPTNSSLSLSNNLLAAPPTLRDAGIGLESASQFALPAKYLNDSHPFPNSR